MTESLEFKISDVCVQRAAILGVIMSEKKVCNFMSNVPGYDTSTKSILFTRNQCNVWSGTQRRNSNQVGKFIKGGNHGIFGSQGAHRLMYAFVHGFPPDVSGLKDNDICTCGDLGGRSHKPKKYRWCCKKIVLHKCKEINGEDHDGLCVNPLHLSLGIYAENQHDIRVHGTGRGGIKIGGSAPQASISDETGVQVWKEIKENRLKSKTDKTRLTQVEIAKKFNVNKNLIKDMVRGKAWGHITGYDKQPYNDQRIARDDMKFHSKMAKRNGTNTQLTVSRLIRPQISNIDAQHIFDDHKIGISKSNIMTKYNVSYRQCLDIIAGRTFKQINREE